MAKKPSYPREEDLQPTKRKTGLTRNRSKALGDKETERDPQEGTEKARECQRSPGTTSTRATIVVFTSVVHPPDSHSIIGLARGTT